MELIFLDESKHLKRSRLNITLKGCIYFKKHAIDYLGITHESRYRFAYDKDSTAKEIFFIEDPMDGRKITKTKTTCFIVAKNILSKLNLDKARQANYELFEHEGYKGFKITVI